MQRTRSPKATLLAVLCAGLFGYGLAYADKPEHAGGGGRAGQHERGDKGHGGQGGGGHGKFDRDDRGPLDLGGAEQVGRSRNDGSRRVVTRFEEHDRTIIRDYFSRSGGSGKCPPGLAKKGNGCMPPGLARKWSVGRPLPRDVAYYDLPPALVVELGVPPAGHKFVRVAGDILMIAVGTSMVVDAIQDLGGM